MLGLGMIHGMTFELLGGGRLTLPAFSAGDGKMQGGQLAVFLDKLILLLFFYVPEYLVFGAYFSLLSTTSVVVENNTA